MAPAHHAQPREHVRRAADLLRRLALIDTESFRMTCIVKGVTAVVSPTVTVAPGGVLVTSSVTASGWSSRLTVVVWPLESTAVAISVRNDG